MCSAREVYRITLIVSNVGNPGRTATRLELKSLLRSLISVHSILHVERGEFTSLMDAPEIRCGLTLRTAGTSAPGLYLSAKMATRRNDAFPLQSSCMTIHRLHPRVPETSVMA